MKTATIRPENSIFYMVDMQNDFVKPSGKLYVPGAETLIPTVQELQEYARSKGFREYASVDRHFHSDQEIDAEHPNWSTTFPPHCMNRTPGQAMVFELMLENAFYVEDKLDERGSRSFYKYDDLQIYLSSSRQVVFEKQSNDVATNPHFTTAINYLKGEGVRNAILYGVATSYCVKDAVQGLLERDIKVYVVANAIKDLPGMDSASPMKQWREHGAEFVYTSNDPVALDAAVHGADMRSIDSLLD